MQGAEQARQIIFESQAHPISKGRRTYKYSALKKFQTSLPVDHLIALDNNSFCTTDAESIKIYQECEVIAQL